MAGHRHPFTEIFMIYSNDKDIDQLICDEVDGGARFVGGSKHGKLFLASGGLVVFSITPSEHRALRNLKSQIARLRRMGGRRA